MKEIGQKKYQQSHQETTHRGKNLKSPLAYEILQIWPMTSLRVSRITASSPPFTSSLWLFSRFHYQWAQFPGNAVVVSLTPFRSFIRCHLPSETTLNTQHISTPNIHYFDGPALFLFFSFGLYPLKFKFAEDRDAQELEKYLAHNRCSINICQMDEWR